MGEKKERGLWKRSQVEWRNKREVKRPKDCKMRKRKQCIGDSQDWNNPRIGDTTGV